MLDKSDFIKWLAVMLMCFVWGFAVGAVFGWNPYAVIVVSLVAVLIVYTWGQ